MGLNLPLVTQAYTASEDQKWLGSAHGTNEADPITLDGDTFLASFPTGIVPSGVVLGKITATGLYRQMLAASTDGSQTAVGHLFTTTDLGGTTAATVDRVSAALYWHGEVVEADLPANHGLTAAAKTALNQIRYV